MNATSIMSKLFMSAALLTAIIATSGCSISFWPSRTPSRSDVDSARFEATVYEVLLTQTRLADLDVETLEKQSATPQELGKVLEGLGETKELYKIDQVVNLYGDSIVKETKRTVITNQQIRKSDPPNTIAVSTREIVTAGLKVNISSNALLRFGQSEICNVQVVFQLTDKPVSGISANENSNRMLDLQLSQSRMLKFGKPSVLLNAFTLSGGDGAISEAYVICYTFKKVK